MTQAEATDKRWRPRPSQVELAVARLSHLQVGDSVYVGNSRRPRVIRRIGRDPDGRLQSITLAIRHCSWTRRPYTVYVRCDLYRVRASGLPRVSLRKRSDLALRRCIENQEDRSLGCCDVAGWP